MTAIMAGTDASVEKINHGKRVRTIPTKKPYTPPSFRFGPVFLISVLRCGQVSEGRTRPILDTDRLSQWKTIALQNPDR
jgi:hypothetical protein